MMGLTPQSRVHAEPAWRFIKVLVFFSNVSALSAPSASCWDGAGGVEEHAELRLPAVAGAEAPWGSPRLPLQPWEQKGSGMSDSWLSPARMQPQLSCKEGSGACLAGGEMRALVLTPELELVLQRGRSNGCSPPWGSPSHAGAVPLHQCKGDGCDPPHATSRGCGAGSASPRARRKWSRITEQTNPRSFPETFPRGPRGASPFAPAPFEQARCLGTTVHAPSPKASLMTFQKGPSPAAKSGSDLACAVWFASCLHADLNLIGVEQQQLRRWASDKSRDYSPLPDKAGCVRITESVTEW